MQRAEESIKQYYKLEKENDYMNLEDTATILGIKPATLKQKVQRGLIRPYSNNPNITFKTEKVEAYQHRTAIYEKHKANLPKAYALKKIFEDLDITAKNFDIISPILEVAINEYSKRRNYSLDRKCIDKTEIVNHLTKHEIKEGLKLDDITMKSLIKTLTPIKKNGITLYPTEGVLKWAIKEKKSIKDCF